MSHYIDNIEHPRTRDSAIKSGLGDTGASVTYIRPDDPYENAHKRGQTILVSSECGNKMPSNTACVLALYQFPDKLIVENLLPGISHRSLISIGQICDVVCKEIFYEQTVNITKMGNIILKYGDTTKLEFVVSPFTTNKQENKTSILNLPNKNVM